MAKISKFVQNATARVAILLPILKRLYPDAACSLDFSTPLELLVATILSAQCTDARVNVVTKPLFQKYRTAADYAGAPEGELEQMIQSTGFFNAKAKNIRTMAAALLAEHGGEVPRTMEQLVPLAGVGRKTANVLLGNAFDINVGVVVDTHIGRLSQRLGLTKHDDPVKIEQDLMRLVPQPEWTLWAHLLIQHGRRVCIARKPRCLQCALVEHCPSGKPFIRDGVAADP